MLGLCMWIGMKTFDGDDYRIVKPIPVPLHCHL